MNFYITNLFFNLFTDLIAENHRLVGTGFGHHNVTSLSAIDVSTQVKLLVIKHKTCIPKSLIPYYPVLLRLKLQILEAGVLDFLVLGNSKVRFIVLLIG